MMLSFKQFLADARPLKEGFMGFSVDMSDSASDLSYVVFKAIDAKRAELKKQTGGIAPDVAIDAVLVDTIIAELRKGLKDKGNAYNTHGTLNVAMILDERMDKYVKNKKMNAFFKEIAAKLNKELETTWKDRQKDDYAQEMKVLANTLTHKAKTAIKEELEQLTEDMAAKFDRICKAEAAKLMGVSKNKVNVVYYDDGKVWQRYNDLWLMSKEGDTTFISPDQFGLGGDLDDEDEIQGDGTEMFTVYTSKSGEKFVKGEWNDYGGGDDPHFYVAIADKK